MKRMVYCLTLVGFVAISSGCSTVHDAFHSVREDITDFTAKDEHRESAKDFLDDAVMLGITKIPDQSKTQEYCKSVSGETGQKLHGKVFAVAKTMDGLGFSGLIGEKGLVGNKPTMDFTQRYLFCNNFLAFASALTPDDKRKLLIFLGADYFSANWMQQKLKDGDYKETMKIGKIQREMIKDTTYQTADVAPFTPDADKLQSYLQQRIDWQFRNAGIAMLGWFKKVDMDKELGLVNPASMEELNRKYSLYRDTGFAWFTTEQHRLLGKGVNLMTFNNSPNNILVADVIDVWGGKETISRSDSQQRLQKLFDRFPPSPAMYQFFFELGKQTPDLGRVKRIALGSVSEKALREAKKYARWLANGKKHGAVTEDGKEHAMRAY